MRSRISLPTRSAHPREVRRQRRSWCRATGTGNARPSHAPWQSGLLLDQDGRIYPAGAQPRQLGRLVLGRQACLGAGRHGHDGPPTTSSRTSTENTEMVLFWGCDPETTPWGFSGQFASSYVFLEEIGIKQVYICPDLNYGAAVHADKWIPVLPNTDAALQLAIIYMWIKEGTYDKEYVETHVVGFDKFGLCHGQGGRRAQDAGMGLAQVRRAGVDHQGPGAEIGPRRPSPSPIISAAAMCAGPYSHEPARLEVCLLGMQGLGKPGVHQHQIAYWGMPTHGGPRRHLVLESGDRRAAGDPAAVLDRELAGVRAAQDAGRTGTFEREAAEVQRHAARSKAGGQTSSRNTSSRWPQGGRRARST